MKLVTLFGGSEAAILALQTITESRLDPQNHMKAAPFTCQVNLVGFFCSNFFSFKNLLSLVT